MRGRVHLRALIAATLLAFGCGRHGFVSGDGSDSNGGSGSDDATGGGDATVSAIKPIQAGPTLLTTSGGSTPTLPVASKSGNLLVATFAMSSTMGLAAPSGWTIAPVAGSNTICFVAIAYYPNNPGGIASATFNFQGGVSSVAQLSEWAGVASNPLDEFGMETAAAGTSAMVATSLATSNADDLAITAFCQYATNAMFTAESGWTNLGGYSSPGTNGGCFTTDYRRALPQGIVSETETSSFSAQWAGVVATFHP
jgi:hypothetical protein